MQKETLKLTKNDYYDADLVELGGQDYLIEREQVMAKSSQFNLLSKCGYKTPNFGKVSDLKRFLRGTEAGNSNIELFDDLVIKSNEQHHLKLDASEAFKKVSLMDKESWVYPFAGENIKFKRMVFIGSSVLEYEIIPKNEFESSFWLDGTGSNDNPLCSYGELSTVDINESQIKRALSIVGKFFPCFSIDLIETKKEKCAVGLNTGPIFQGTPIEEIGDSNIMAQEILTIKGTLFGGGIS